jgi:2-amino-4-hydroxy-6-hydroxymethyldihydropteridine diphosphokinase
LFRILKIVQEVERAMGRVRTAGGYTDRIIDLDILYYGNLNYTSPDLTIPHPHIMDRDFVKIPLAEVRPDLLKKK